MSPSAVGTGRSLLPLYVASAIVTLAEGSVQVLLGPYLDLRGLPSSWIGLLLSGYGVAALSARLVTGSVYRARRARLIIVVGCVLMSISFALLSQASSPWALGLLVALDGAGLGLATTGGMAAIMASRPDGADAGSIMGWYTGFTGGGYAVAGLLGGMLGDALGVPRAMLAVSVIPLVAAAALHVALRHLHADAMAAPATTPGRLNPLRQLGAVPAEVWVAFSVTLYLALVNGVLLVFFPIHGIAVGLTLTQVGMLLGIHGAFASGVRFLSGPLFRWIDYRRTLPLAMGVSAAAVVTLSGPPVLLLLAIAWAAIGASRGVLRVASGALAMDMAGSDDRAHGAASTVYLSGLDVGKIIGPVIGGGLSQAVGLRPTFAVIGLAFPLVYVGGTVAARRQRERRPAGEATVSRR